jgi:hypothetical protein
LWADSVLLSMHEIQSQTIEIGMTIRKTERPRECVFQRGPPLDLPELLLRRQPRNAPRIVRTRDRPGIAILKHSHACSGALLSWTSAAVRASSQWLEKVFRAWPLPSCRPTTTRRTFALQDRSRTEHSRNRELHAPEMKSPSIGPLSWLFE